MSRALHRLGLCAGAMSAALALAAPLALPVAPKVAASAPVLPSAVRALPALKAGPELLPVARPALLAPAVVVPGAAGVAPQPAGNPANPGPVYVLIQGARQGRFKGDVLRQGLGTSDAVWQLSYALRAPLDPASGQRAGAIRGQPLVFRHALGTMAVQLQQALVSNERLDEVVFHSFAPDASGRELPVLTLRLLKAAVLDLSEVTPQTSGAERLQEVTLDYQRLEVTDLGSGLVAVDDRANPAR